VQEDRRNFKMLSSWMPQPPNVGKYGCKEADISHAYRRATEVGGHRMWPCAMDQGTAVYPRMREEVT
jgi:hypothetical protein